MEFARSAWLNGGASRPGGDRGGAAEAGLTQLNLLGPLEILVSGVTLSPGGAKPQILFAYLCLNVNRHVSVGNIIEATWGERPPSSAKKNTQLYVSRLRSQFGRTADVRLITTSDGYQLSVESDRVDLERCQRLWQLGKESLQNGAPKEAGRLLREAIRLWRGKPLSGLTKTLFMQAEAARLEQFRLGLLMKYFQAQLADGQHFEIIPELLAAVDDYPHQEQLRADLMLALWRSGQRHAALAAYREAYQLLADELGISPGRQLRTLHQAILADDAEIVSGIAANRAISP
ncbi:BTAD domain-containing putative transcriptional regulator [Streptomyces sp. NPDC008092]|uniref:AfsR/SARP family transcriptional regulator n=1 Tax=Streptomyces sp. NPDC008092 TaxID=3364808 RepID=UPI0036E2FEC8